MLQSALNQEAEKICRLAPVIPVLVIKDASHAMPLAKALVAGGLYALEVTLRTDAALEAIQEMSRVEGARVGAGTLLTPTDVSRAKAAGAVFGVSPGATGRLIDAAEAETFPLLPGAATVSEAMRLAERGYLAQKFFPAVASGGVPSLKAFNGPIPQIRFCPTGGITSSNAADFLALPNVLCVGGSWIAPEDMLQSNNWAEITELARQAAML